MTTSNQVPFPAMNMARRVLAALHHQAVLRTGFAPLVGVVGFGLLILRRPEGLTRPDFYAESAPFFYVPTYFHDPGTLFTTPFAGYLHTIPRIVSYVERLVPPAQSPLVGTLVSLAVVMATAFFFASRRMGSVLPSAQARLALCAVVILTPTAGEILGRDVNLQVYLSAYLVGLAIASPAVTLAGRLLDGGGAALAGLSGPFSILLFPLFLVRRTWLTFVVGACALAQLGVILSTPQRPLAHLDPRTAIEIVALRVKTAVLGPTVAMDAPDVLAPLLVVAAILIAAHTPHRRLWISFLYAGVVVAASGVAVYGPRLVLHAFNGERHFWLASIAFAALVIAGLQSQSRATVWSSRGLAVLIIIGVVVNFRLAAGPPTDWAGQSSCIGSLKPCVIEVWPERFRVEWPGLGGEYPLPEHGPPER